LSTVPIKTEEIFPQAREHQEAGNPKKLGIERSKQYRKERNEEKKKPETQKPSDNGCSG